MTLDFDLEHVSTVEFGVGRDDGDSRIFCLVPVASDVQDALREMAVATWKAMQELAESPPEYEPSQKYENYEHVYLPLDDELASFMRQLHHAENMDYDSSVLNDPSTLFCYFSRMTDVHGKRLTAVRRATQFKGVLKSRLVRLLTDTLRLVEDHIFKLDRDFDLLVDSQRVYILRPSGFEFVGKLQQAILAAVPRNVEAIEQDIPFVDFTLIREYASTHARAARYLASIRGQKGNIDREALINLCKATGVEVQVVKGKVTVLKGHEMGLLEILDRRRYEVELVKGSPERFRATGREKIES